MELLDERPDLALGTLPARVMNDPFLAQLAELCSHEPSAPKWVIVPSPAVGWTLAERLALNGVAWANLRFATMHELARDLAAPHLLEAGLDPVPDGLSASLLLRLLLDLPDSDEGYFRPLAEQPRMADCLWASLLELRLEGYRADSFPFEQLEPARKADELRSLLLAYEDYLGQNRLADQADLYRVAIQRVGEAPMAETDPLLVLPGLRLPRLARELLSSLPGRRLPGCRPELPGWDLPSGWPADQEVAGGSDLRWLTRPVQVPRVQTLAAGGRDAELEEVFRRVLEQGIPLDQVELVASQSELRLELWEKACRLGLPVSLSDGLPAARTRDGRAVKGLLSWIESGFSASELRSLILAGDLVPPDGLVHGPVASILTHSHLTWGRETYRRGLGAASLRLRAQAEEEHDNAELRLAQAERVETLQGWIQSLLDRLPAEQDNQLELGALIEALLALQRPQADPAITRALRELLSLAPFWRPRTQILRLVRERLERLRLGASRPRPGCLYVTGLQGAGRSGRRYLALLGLEEGRVFSPPIEDPVLLDCERSALGLPTSLERIHEQVSEVLLGLATSEAEQAVFSYSLRDLRENRETVSSWLFKQALRLERGPEADSQECDPVTVVASRAGSAPSVSSWWLSRLVPTGPAAARWVLQAYPWLARGQRAVQARESALFTEYDGLVSQASELDPRRSGRPVSATALETLAACPFRWFLERALGLTRREMVSPNPDQWLDALLRGSLMHDLLALFLRRLRSAGQRPSRHEHERELLDLLEKKLQELRKRIPPVSEALYEEEAEGLRIDLGKFLDHEERLTGHTPVALEVTFGMTDNEGEPLDRAEPVSLELGASGVLNLRGRIDRIDRLADGTYQVIDYKTGARPPHPARAVFAYGRQLQHALYALVAEELLGGRVSSGAYFFPSIRAAEERSHIERPDQRQLFELIGELLAIVEGGAFVHTPDPNHCRWCDFRAACHQKTERQAQVKLENSANEVLEPYRRLRAYP